MSSPTSLIYLLMWTTHHPCISWHTHLTHHPSLSMHTIICLAVGSDCPHRSPLPLLTHAWVSQPLRGSLTDWARMTVHGSALLTGLWFPYAQAMVSCPTRKLPHSARPELHSGPPPVGPLRLWVALCPRCIQSPSPCRRLRGGASSNNNRTEFFWKGEGKLEKVLFIY